MNTLHEECFGSLKTGAGSKVVENAMDPQIGIIIDDAMEAIERDNPELRNVLPKNFGNPI